MRALNVLEESFRGYVLQITVLDEVTRDQRIKGWAKSRSMECVRRGGTAVVSPRLARDSALESVE